MPRFDEGLQMVELASSEAGLASVVNITFFLLLNEGGSRPQV